MGDRLLCADMVHVNLIPLHQPLCTNLKYTMGAGFNELAMHVVVV